MRRVWLPGMSAVLGACGGSMALSPTGMDAGVTADTATLADSGTVTDTASPSDRATLLDVQGPMDLGTPTDTSVPADTSVPTDAGTATDVGTPADGGGCGAMPVTPPAPPMPPSCTQCYVSPAGDDSNPGTLTAPFRTIQQAYRGVVPGGTIHLRDGTYREQVSLTGRSGTAGAPITLAAYIGEHPVLSGLDVLSPDWTVTTLPGVTATVYVACFAGASIDQLFYNGRPMLEARWPNVPTGAGGDWNFFSPDAWETVDPAGNSDGTVSDARLAATGWNITGVRAVLNVNHQYYTWTRRVTHHTAGASTFTYPMDLGSSISATRSNDDDRYYLVGERQFLDAPGEWYLDAAAHRLYIIPPDGMNPTGATVEIKTRPYGFTADSASSYLTVDGITFLGTAFSFGQDVAHRSNHIVLQNNTVLYGSWTDWLFMPTGDPHQRDDSVNPTLQSDDSQVVNNTFAYGALHGFFVNGLRMVVENNIVHDVDYSSSLRYPAAAISQDAPGYVGNGGQSTVRYNTVYNSGGVLMYVGQPGNDVSLNDLHDAFRACWGGNVDHAALYTQLNQSGTRFHHNWVHGGVAGSAPQPFGGGLGIRGDDNTVGLTVDHNVTWSLGSAGITVKNPNGATLAQANGCYNNTAFQYGSSNPFPAGIVLPTQMGQNLYSALANNMAQAITRDFSGNPVGAIRLNASNVTAVAADTLLENVGWFDFRPQAGTRPVDTGMVVSGITGTVVGAAPDVGAYERGDSTYWIPGHRGPRASFPIVPDGATGVSVHRDVLMWRPAYNAMAHRIYLGTSLAAVTAAGPTATEFQGVVSGTVNVHPLPALTAGQTYFWRIDAVMPDGTVVAGDIWRFTTGP